jgi:hypothetical protein
MIFGTLLIVHIPIWRFHPFPRLPAILDRQGTVMLYDVILAWRSVFNGGRGSDNIFVVCQNTPERSTKVALFC